MNVSDLRKIIGRLRDDDEIVIPIVTMAGSVGGRATVSLKGMYSGFDWERGKVFCEPETPVHLVGEHYQDEKKRSRDKGEALAFLWMTATNKSLTDAQKLKAFRSTLKRFGFNVSEPESAPE